jgi:hypothetical protein
MKSGSADRRDLDTEECYDGAADLPPIKTVGIASFSHSAFPVVSPNNDDELRLKLGIFRCRRR